MVAMSVEDDGWECECGEWNHEDDDECATCWKYWE